MGVVIGKVIEMARNEKNVILIDWGANEATEKTGSLAAGDTVASCTVSVWTKPDGAADPTLSSVTVPSNTLSDDINGRVWATGEATACTITMASNQTAGLYILEFKPTTTNALVLPRYVRILVKVPA